MEPQFESPPARITPKFSRYKSVRRAAAADAERQAQEESAKCAPPMLAAKAQSDTIARSMSRYRRHRTAPTGPAAIDTPPMPALPTASQTSAKPRPEGAARNEIGETATRGNNRGVEARIDQADDEELSEVEKARMREEAMRALTMAERPRAASRAPAIQQHLKQKAPDMEKRQELKQSDIQSANAHKRASWKDKFGFSRHKASADHARSHDKPGPEATQGNAEPLFPGIDAPLSAVNAGERRVLIKHNSTSIHLPVLPTTRVKDLVYSATNLFSANIDSKTAIMLESFSSLGLERPLRRYEHVRDVMNSWTVEDANALVISESPYEGASDRLELKAAPATQPSDATFYLYYSSKPGKWDKRYVTLRTDGQVVISKKSDPKEAKDYSNICHISDFDIYTPTNRQLSKKLRPPKKICFAIKSQQKSSLFVSTENFVHFFATSDAQLAQNWYDAVHGWRCWYLVHVVKLSEKHQETVKSSAMPGDEHGQLRHRHHMSTDSAPYQLGSFKPLVEFGRNAESDVEMSDKRSVEYNGSGNSRDMFLRKKKTRDHAPPPTSYSSTLTKLDTGNGSISEQDDGSTFSPDSLLGRVYSQRQAAQREREAKENEAFMSQGLLNNLSPSTSNPSSHSMPFSNPSTRHNNGRSNTVPSHHHPEDVSHSRSNSVRQKPKPLVDLTPVYREPPQHARKGHGVKIGPGMPLVEAATGLEPIPGVPDIPSATTWRREQAQPVTANESSAASIISRRANTIRSPQHGEMINSPNFPFMPNGLVALSGNSPATGQANIEVGRGIATGDRHTTRPLLDMTPASQFAEGSLLHNIERGM
ncbi:hypothetical protein BGW36DRAFT_290067 [Talaromyces proteolyticus]|uniref:PH domain-containing protein n=1 Tax=Talaromyces proteolyticus TaxID=1131652 RepID=A0AAD4Q191_9EURO|nr:uncharacterized protein BGW36DRAFT_290067 [Talaromyces proteolyticus]KAH8702034.1 hypothetical protein BGW36DRAFT_290067 [Talaromyces proteolyticus]